MKSEPTSPTESFSNHLSPVDASASAGSSEPKVAVHHQQLFGQTSATLRGSSSQQSFVSGQTGVSAHVAMYGQFPRISDIRSFAPGVPAMPAVAESSFKSPYAAYPAQQSYGLWPQPQPSHAATTYYRTTQQSTHTAYTPKEHGLPTPDDTPPDAFLMLPGLSSATSQGEAVDTKSNTTAAFNPGLGLIFESTGDATAPGAQSKQSAAQPRRNPLPALRPRPVPLPIFPMATHASRINMSYQERVLETVSRWMAGPAQALSNGVDLVYTMAACDKHLPRNEVYDPTAYDEEDVDTDEE